MHRLLWIWKEFDGGRMLYIKKGKIPHEFKVYAALPGSHFDDMPTAVKHSLRAALLEEQGFLCAYCMSGLDEAGTKVKIEHYEARNDDNELDYQNLLAVCNGGEGRAEKHQTCDTHKGDKVLHLSPLRREMIDTIYYTRNGRICSTIPDYQTDLDVILNLNDEDGYLVNNRRNTLQAFQKQVYKRYGKQAVSLEYLQRYRHMYEKKREGKYRPYAGIILWYIDQRLRRIGC